MGGEVRLEREKLYGEVWATPVVQLAKRYGLSDRGLAKVCDRMNICVPGRRYWRRKQTGQAVFAEPLPPLKEGQRDKLVIRTVVQRPSSQEMLEFEKRIENRITVAKDRSTLHPQVEQIRQTLQKTKEDKTGILVGEDEWCAALRASKAALDRAILILDALFRAFDVRGYTVSILEKQPHITINGGQHPRCSSQNFPRDSYGTGRPVGSEIEEC